MEPAAPVAAPAAPAPAASPAVAALGQEPASAAASRGGTPPAAAGTGGGAASAATPSSPAATPSGAAAANATGSSGKKVAQQKTPFQKEALEAAFARRFCCGAAPGPLPFLLLCSCGPPLTLPVNSGLPSSTPLSRLCCCRSCCCIAPVTALPIRPGLAGPAAAAAVSQYPTEDMKRVLGSKIGLTAQQVGVSVLPGLAACGWLLCSSCVCP